MPIVAFIWGLAGLILGWPYFWLAGGGESYFVPCFFLVPIASATGGIIYVLARVLREEQARGAKIIFPAYVLWVSSPIIMNGLSHLLRFMNDETTAKILFAHRFVPIWLPIVALIIGLIGIMAVIGGYQQGRERLAKFRDRSGADDHPPH